jgi:hypothetical protein
LQFINNHEVKIYKVTEQAEQIKRTFESLVQKIKRSTVEQHGVDESKSP